MTETILFFASKFMADKIFCFGNDSDRKMLTAFPASKRVKAPGVLLEAVNNENIIMPVISRLLKILVDNAGRPFHHLEVKFLPVVTALYYL